MCGWQYQVYTLGSFQTNSYVLWKEDKVLVIDPSYNPSQLLHDLSQLPPLSGIFLTHTHIDHIAGLGAILDLFPCPVYVHPAEASWIANPNKNLSALLDEPLGFQVKPTPVTEEMNLGLEDVRILHIPGHSPGSLCLWLASDHLAFVGDLIFKDSVGRTDFPGGDGAVLNASLVKLIRTLPYNCVLLPGHGPKTSLEREIYYNPYVREALASEVVS
jgi:glyoxylase-like metal-dependent hydrolase (beta-lactamase superfamily II)